jgi:hypothetical protein
VQESYLLDFARSLTFRHFLPYQTFWGNWEYRTGEKMKNFMINKYRGLIMLLFITIAITLTSYIGTNRATAFAVFTVSNNNNAGTGSLRQAITDANTAGGGTINFDAGVTGLITIITALPDLTSAITINGPGSGLLAVQRSYDAGIPEFTIFRITGSNVTINGLTLKNGLGLYGGIYRGSTGTLTLNDCAISSSGGYQAGGIYNDVGGSVILTGCLLVHNHTRQGAGSGGIYNFGTLSVTNSRISNNYSYISGGGGGNGGGIINTGTAMITNSLIDNNTSAGGGAISNNSILTLTNSSIVNNIAIGSGGAITTSGNASITTLINSTLANNSAKIGGAILLGGILNLTNTTIAYNTAIEGGAIYTQGGLGVGSGTVNMTASTIAGNTATNGAGGLHISAVAGPCNMQSSIVASNNGLTPDIQGVISSLGNNLIGNTTGNSGGDNSKGDLLNIDPLFELGPDSKPLLKDNGGPTQTIALLATSPAIDKGKNLAGLTTDQRGTGFVRTYDNPLVSNGMGDGTDIGAFEVQMSPYDICIQDDSTSATLQINSQTGDYLLCCGGQSYSGRGQITRRGSVLILESNIGNRRLQAKLDQATRRASASLQSTGGATLCTIVDRDFTNNNCVCSQ